MFSKIDRASHCGDHADGPHLSTNPNGSPSISGMVPKHAVLPGTIVPREEAGEEPLHAGQVLCHCTVARIHLRPPSCAAVGVTELRRAQSPVRTLWSPLGLPKLLYYPLHSSSNDFNWWAVLSDYSLPRRTPLHLFLEDIFLGMYVLYARLTSVK